MLITIGGSQTTGGLYFESYKAVVISVHQGCVSANYCITSRHFVLSELFCNRLFYLHL